MSDICAYCKEEIDIYCCLDVNGIEELCCQDCHDDLYLEHQQRTGKNK